jgi:hypothetical protein
MPARSRRVISNIIRSSFFILSYIIILKAFGIEDFTQLNIRFDDEGYKVVYLAEHTIKGRKKYILRDSHFNHETNCWQSRDLFDLGSSPWEYIQYPGGNAFYIKESVSEQIAVLDVEHDACELEELFWPFIRQDIRQKIEPFYCRGMRRGRKKGIKNLGEEQVQIFDKRRMYFLRCGESDMRRVGSMPLRHFKALLNKSRDEIEQYILQLEKNLTLREYKQYIYIVFDLQRYFGRSLSRSIPQTLDQDELDTYFLKDLCSLHHDKNFWAGYQKEKKLHEYLVRYAVMFFDYEFDGGNAWNEYLQDFMDSKRFHRPAAPRATVAMTEVVQIFGMTEKDLHAMNKGDLIKLYRQKAHELHPDKGGEHDDFVRLTEAYKQLVRMMG